MCTTGVLVPGSHASSSTPLPESRPSPGPDVYLFSGQILHAQPGLNDPCRHAGAMDDCYARRGHRARVRADWLQPADGTIEPAAANRRCTGDGVDRASWRYTTGTA